MARFKCIFIERTALSQSPPLCGLAGGMNFHLDKILLDFWMADSLSDERTWTQDEQLAEDIFSSTHSRDSTGRYVVRIPLKKDHKALGVSKNVAKARFLATEKKFARNPELFKLYKAVFDDYRAKNQMVLAPQIHPNCKNVYYLSHHAINIPVTGNNSSVKKGKFRVVFDPSVPTSNGVSFNDLQLSGPKLHDDLNKIFLRFRSDHYPNVHREYQQQCGNSISVYDYIKLHVQR